MVTKGAALVAGGAAIPVDVKRADCNSSRTRLKRAMWKKRALVKAPSEMRLGREVQIQETSSTLDVSKIKLHLSHSTTTWPCLQPRRKKRKKMVKPIAPRSTSDDTEDPDYGNPSCRNKNTPHKHWLPKVHFRLQPTPT